MLPSPVDQERRTGDSEVRFPPDTARRIDHPGGMPSSLPAPLASAAAAMLTSFRPSLRLVGRTGLPASKELQAFLAALATVHADAPTACEGWTAHELVAHMAAGSREMTRLITARLEHGAGIDIGPTREFAEREAPFRAMADSRLRRQFIVEGFALTSAIQRLRAAGPGVTVTFTGWAMTVDELILHGKSELALHRWDLVGTDDLSQQLLSRPELMAHGEKVLARMDLPDAGSMSRPDRAAGEGGDALLRLWGRDLNRWAARV
jgi:hypothetical protein